MREVDYDLKNLTAKLEPILIGIVAVIVLVLRSVSISLCGICSMWLRVGINSMRSTPAYCKGCD
ncbi:MSHA biogenesis protein MshG [Shewanella putrefaciens]|nr:MSHA biogenesis protein MshG [Shewanella putrefaciens]